jgi:uncharacterized membrane protein YtjA (UPF0391 family)
MLGAAVLFFLLAIVAAFFGFTGIAGISSTIAWVLLAVFVALFILSLLVRLSVVAATPILIFRGG